jgi:hypothetical protein
MKARVLAVSVLLFFSIPSVLAQFEHPDLKSGKKKVISLVLMPVQAEVTKVGMKGSEPMMQESRDTEQALTPVVAKVLQDLGYKVDQDSLAPAILEKDSDLRYTVDDLQKKFDEELKQMNRKSKDVRKGRFTLGDEVTKLPAGEKVDALLFVRAEGQVLTGGKKTFGWLVTGAVFDVVMMHFGVVDSRTGDVLYFAKPVALKNITKKTEEAAGTVKKSFKNFVKASPPGAAPTEAAEKPAKS